MKTVAIVEMPQGSWLKYEVDKDDGLLKVDRALNQPIPYTYGFIPKTLCGDGDPLDVFIVIDEPIPPLTKVPVEIWGALRCVDNGHSDDKLLAFISGNTQFPDGFGMSLIKNYLQTYKSGFEVKEVLNKQDALKLLEEAQQKYEQDSGN